MSAKSAAPDLVPPHSSPSTLLFIDDDPSILSSLRRLFRRQGYRILTGEGGASGLDILRRERVDLVISDMRMPEMDGVEFLERVRVGYPNVIRLLLTGYADIGSTIAAINRGEIYRYITKPWDDNDIVLIVRDALERRRLEGENARLLELTRLQNEELKTLNSGLESRVRERTAELEQANRCLNLANEQLRRNFLITIKIFSSLMELRGGSVGGHARRVAELARKLAIHMALDAGAQQDVFIAALLHDIGKIGFSDALLARPVTRMTTDELGCYRKHSLDGARALMPLVELHEVAGIIRSHHERFDGRGFPDGLIGAEIPLGARIIAVTNDYDGLQMGTLLQRKLDAQEAVNMLAHWQDRRFDPQVVEAFIDLMGQPREERSDIMDVPVESLEAGMVLADDLLSRTGTLLLAADYVLDSRLVRSIRRYAEREGLDLVLRIHIDSMATDCECAIGGVDESNSDS